MGNKKLRIQICGLLIGGFLLCAVPPLLGGDVGLFGTQGLINPGGNFKAGYLFINEMRVYIDKTTQLMDHRETPILIKEFQPKHWVYMEVEKDPKRKFVRARKIYLLPHYIDPKERAKFKFMK